MANRLVPFANFIALAEEQGDRVVTFAFHSISAHLELQFRPARVPLDATARYTRGSSRFRVLPVPSKNGDTCFVRESNQS
jgi:hypothetical protein